MQSVIVTGAAGFIGSHLTERLLAAGHRVLAVDSLTPYYDREIKLANVADLVQREGLTWRETSLLELPPRDLVAADAVFHLAAQPGVRPSWGVDSFRTYLEENVTATHRLLEILRSAGSTAPFVFASSSSVYGEIGADGVTEDHPLRPESPYGVTKLASERLVRVYGSRFGLSTVCLRFFTVYGPRQRPDMAMHRFLFSALTGAPVPFFGDGEQQRDFTFVGDVVEAIIRSGQEADALRGDVFNVGGGFPTSLKEVVDIVENLTGQPLNLDRQAAPAGDVRRTAADISRSTRALGWRPTTTLQDGLAQQLRVVQERVDAGLYRLEQLAG